MDGLLMNAAIARRQLRRARVFRDRDNPLERLENHEIKQRYRFCRESIYRLSGMLQADLMHPTQRNHALPVLFQVLLALRFYSCGTYQRVIGDASINVSIATVCRCIRSVSVALSRRRNQYIRFPNAAAMTETKRQLWNIAGFPNVVGLIDCTHVRIIAPSQNEPDYVNRKGFHSLNIQAVCNANYIITNIVARWPGSCHDARIFRESALYDAYERREIDGLLLGDSGYPLRPYLMTPFIAPQTEPQTRFNAAHQRTRVRIEQAFGILKKRFGCLHGEIRMSPDRACSVIVACACLHNYAIMQHDLFDDEGLPADVLDDLADGGIVYHQPENADGQIVRNVIVNHFA